jgi:Family of unknown function (DUF6159)
MFNRISNSWELFKASANVLWADKELMIFPIISAIGTVIVTATFMLPLFAANLFDSILAGHAQIFGLVLLFLFYVVQYLVIFFANTALVGAALIRLRGGDPTVADGLRIATDHFGSIFGYALIAATVGMILKLLSNRRNGFGRMVVSLVGLGWNIATYLVVPILAVEDVGPVEAIKRSVALLKKTWGEEIAGQLGMGAFFGLASFLVIIVGIFLTVAAASMTNALALPVIVALMFVLVLVLLGLVNSALTGIYTAAVYKYAVEGSAGHFFDETLVKNTFRVRANTF